MGFGQIDIILVAPAASWASSSQILRTYQAGLESDTGKWKKGDGLNVFSSLSYIPTAGGGGGDMLSSNNLADVADAQASRLNIFPSISGNANKYLRVNAGETDYELVTLAGGGDMLGANNLTDVADAATSLANLGISGSDITNWNTAFSWGDHALAGYLTSESDPIFSASDAAGISSTDISNWNTAFGWGNHAAAGYVPYTGATNDVDLGANSLTVTNIGIGTPAGAELLHLDGGASVARIKLDADNNIARIFSFRTDDVQRWAFRVDGNETGSNTGANFAVRRYNDAGTYIDSPIEITRNAGTIKFNSFDFGITGNVTALSGSNTGDQTSIAGITGTKSQFNTACTDGNFLYTGDITQYTDEMAQDAIGAMIDGTLEYVDGTPLLTRAALSGAIAASAGSNTTSLGSFTKSQLDTAVSDGNVLYVGDVTQYTDEMAQDAVGAMATNGTFVSLTYSDATPSLTADLSATGTPSATTYLRGDNTWASSSDFALKSGDLSQFASTTSAQMRTLISDEQGTGLMVFNANPAFAGSITPVVNDGSTLGSTSLQWADLFLASGGVINWANGNATLTHSTGALAFSAVPLTIPVMAVTTTTSTSLTFTSAHYGTAVLWSPGGTATATLPANGATAGSWFDVYLLTNQTVTISAATADTLITFNDTQADSVAFSTTNAKTGGVIRFISNGTVWFAVNLSNNTMTVAT